MGEFQRRLHLGLFQTVADKQPFMFARLTCIRLERIEAIRRVRCRARHHIRCARTVAEQQPDLAPAGLICQRLHGCRCAFQRRIRTVMTHHDHARRRHIGHVYKQTRRPVPGREITRIALLRKKTA